MSEAVHHEQQRPLRVMVVDDHPMFRMGLVALLSSLEQLHVVAEADSASSAVAAAEEHRPDVVVMDLHLVDSSGIEATREIVAAQPEVGVLVVTMLDDDDSVFAAMRAGARGYLLKGASPEELERAVRAVANGEVLLAPAIADLRLFAGYAGWSGGQLETELGAGGWFVVDSEPLDAFTSRPDDLWRDVLARQRGRLSLFAACPMDPSLN